jgi:hypothetical protein
MPSSVQTLRSRILGKTTVRHCSAWLLGALLLFFCANARLARYKVEHRDLKLATAQSYVDSDETRLELAIAALLLLWFVSIVPVRRFAAGGVSEVAVAIFTSPGVGEFDPESHLRAPPRA